MRKLLVGMTGVLLLTASAWAQIDPRDSILVESKVVAPAAGPAVLTVRVRFSNKDTLSNITFPVEQKSSNGAYAALAYGPSNPTPPREEDGTGTFVKLLPGNQLNTIICNFDFYHSNPPDTFMWTGTAVPPTGARLVPPGPARPLMDMFFDTISTSGPPGGSAVELDSGRVFSNTIQFVNRAGATIRVNFVKGVLTVGVPLQLLLISPADNATVLERRPTFVWHALRDSAAVPAHYTVFVANNPAFSPSDTSPPVTDTVWQIPSDLQFQTSYFWKVRAISNNFDTVVSPETRTFRVDAPPGMPLDLYPSSGADISFNDFLVWLEGEDPDPQDSVTYQIQIDDHADFSSPEVNEGGIDENTQPAAPGEGPLPFAAQGNAIAIQLKTLAQSDNLKDDSLYYWRVRTVDNHGLGSSYTSGNRTFYLNLADSSPHPPGLISPVGGSVITDHRPAFDWLAAADPDPGDPPSSLRYNFRLDTDGEVVNDFQISFNSAPGETTFQALDSLAENGHFFWSVRAIDSKGARSAFSDAQDFFVNAQNEPPGAFLLLSPGDGSFLVTKTPILDWEDAVDPDPLDSAAYTARLSDDSLFASGFTFGPLFVSSHPVAGGLLSRGIDYFWKVTAADGDGLLSGGNQVFKFRILQLGDVNKDGSLTPSDAVLLINFVFTGNPPVDPPELADMNCDGLLNAVDVVIGLNAIFLGEPPPCDP